MVEHASLCSDGFLRLLMTSYQTVAAAAAVPSESSADALLRPIAFEGALTTGGSVTLGDSDQEDLPVAEPIPSSLIAGRPQVYISRKALNVFIQLPRYLSHICIFVSA